MKTPLFYSAAFIFGASLISAHAQTTSVQLIGGSNAPLKDTSGNNAYNYSAGATSVANWNSLLNTGNNGSPVVLTVTSGLITSTGAPSTLGFALTAGSAYYTGAGSGFTSSPAYPGFPGTPSGPGDAFLFEGFAATGYFNANPITLTLNNLNPLDSYSILAYVSPFSGFGQNQNISVSLAGGATFTGLTDGAAGTYEKIGSTGAKGNYVEFDNVAGLVSQTLTVTGSTYVGLSGFQVIDNGALAVPEPSTYALLLAGFVGLVAIARRRTASV